METPGLTYGPRMTRIQCLTQMLAGGIVLLACIQTILILLLARHRPEIIVDQDPDQILKRHLSYVNTENRAVIWHHQRQWLSLIDWNDRCGPVDPFVYYYYYCHDRSRYPILYDIECVAHPIDQYIYHDNRTTSDRFVIEFLDFFTTILNGSEGLKNIMDQQLDIAAQYARRIGFDCEHPAVFDRNFDTNYPSASTIPDLYEFYCYRSIKYPNLFSKNSGKLYLPGYYWQRINSGTLQSDEKWMIDWMEMFLSWYEKNDQLKERFQREKQQAINYAAKMKLSC